MTVHDDKDDTEGVTDVDVDKMIQKGHHAGLAGSL